jgi:heterodisulfide reductase subunit A
LVRGFSKNHKPFYAINETNCRFFQDESCAKCREACPESAIQLEKTGNSSAGEADAVVLATGFSAFDPADKPYGYGVFKNVITNLELERMLRQEGIAKRLSDGQEPERIAFIQCVGSRDAKLKHLWCSKVCCGSALRMARFIKNRKPETGISVFYIDIQTFGRNFEPQYKEFQEAVRLVRAIPGDIFQVENDHLKFTYHESGKDEPEEALFDLVVLSVGLAPNPDTAGTAKRLGLDAPAEGFIGASDRATTNGIFATGTVKGPMSIPESIADAGNTAWQVLEYLGVKTS